MRIVRAFRDFERETLAQKNFFLVSVQSFIKYLTCFQNERPMIHMFSEIGQSPHDIDAKVHETLRHGCERNG